MLSLTTVASAQPSTAVRRIVVISGGSAAAGRPFIEGFRQRLHALGWVEGRNVVVDAQFAEGNMQQLPTLMADVLKTQPDVIVVASSTVAAAARKATGTIPIVMVGVGNPVGLGFAQSLNRPGGNMTGVASLLPDVVAKSFELLKEAVPSATHVAVLSNALNPLHEASLRESEAAGASLGLRITALRVKRGDELLDHFDSMVKAKVDAVNVLGDPTFQRYRAEIAALALARRLPTIFRTRSDVEVGGLIAYGPDVMDLYRRGAAYVDRLLRGALASELPIEQPTKVDLAVNLKTARTLALRIPPSIILRADHVLE